MDFLTKEEDLNLKGELKAFYFYASWMPYHKKMLTMIDKMEKKYPKLKFLAIDTDHFKNTCKRFDIKSIPTVIIFKDSREKNRINGMVLTSAFKNAFSKVIKGDTND